MKIRKIRYENHYLFGDTEFDFTDNKGEVIDTIIIAGENGVGKSCLMEDIYEFSKYEFPRKKENKIIHFEVEISEEQINMLKQQAVLEKMVITFGNIFHITINFNIINDWRAIIVRNILSSGKDFVIDSYRLDRNKTIFQSIFSNSEVNFNSKSIKSIQTSDIDSESSSVRSDSDLATNIAQLLVDIQTLDTQDLSNWVKENSEKAPPNYIIDIRMKRFTNAFDYMFPAKKYKYINNTRNGKEVVFIEGNNEMTLNQLSSGEKQIVFRGGFLLKNRESSKGALILIDEPELSLHPNWQIKSLDFFKKLFTDSEGNQNSQLIVTTHSPFIIHNPNRSNDKVIVLKKDSIGRSCISEHPNFISWTSEEAIKEAFSIDFNFFNNGITVFLEGETDEKYFNTAKRVFNKSELPFRFQWIGRINEQNNAENTGDKSLNSAISFFKANESSIKEKIVFLFDNDTNKMTEDYGSLFIRKMNDGNNVTFKKGIESLLKTDAMSDINNFYSESSKSDDYGGEVKKRSLDKMRLCNYICNELDEESQRQVLHHINHEIEGLQELIS